MKQEFHKDLKELAWFVGIGCLVMTTVFSIRVLPGASMPILGRVIASLLLGLITGTFLSLFVYLAFRRQRRSDVVPDAPLRDSGLPGNGVASL
jgi:hypothetical protein